MNSVLCVLSDLFKYKIEVKIIQQGLEGWFNQSTPSCSTIRTRVWILSTPKMSVTVHIWVPSPEEEGRQENPWNPVISQASLVHALQSQRDTPERGQERELSQQNGCYTGS